MTYFSYLHPFTKFLYFICLSICVMVVFNPICLFFTIIVLLIYATTSENNMIKRNLPFYLYISLFTILINVAFNHRGSLIMLYLFDVPITFEALFYAFTSALFLISIILIFVSLKNDLTNSEFLYLFAKYMPKVSMMINICTGFIGVFTKRIEDIRTILKIKGIDVTTGSLKKRLSDGTQILNVLISLSLEDALVTSTSMKTRGYGVAKRTSYSNYVIKSRDYVYCTIILIISAVVIFGFLNGYMSFSIYPRLKLNAPSIYDLIIYLSYFILISIPLFRMNVYSTRYLEKE